MRIKKIITMVVCTVMFATVLTGCGSYDEPKTETDAKETTEQEEKDNDTAKEESSEKGYVFEVNGVKVAVDADMEPIAEALGEPDSYFEEPSCAAQGIAKLYTYSSFEIDTYPDGDKDLVACVILKDDNVTTLEGVDLSMTKAEVIEVYGENYEETEGRIAYEKDGMKLCFILDGENIAAIEYNSAVLN